MSDDVELQTMDQTDQVDALDLTAEIVSAFLSNNSVPVSGLADLIHSVHQGILRLGQSSAHVEDQTAKATPAQIKKSITEDALISFEDGKGYKTLKRHLNGRGLTPEAYRAKHGLPHDYPMTAPGYSARRSAMAQSFGLGQKRVKAEPKAAERSETVSEAPKARRGRPASGVSPKAPAKSRGGKTGATAVAAK